ncbi:MAG: cytochrome C oxidase subunit IV family protein [Cyclobacteriaceae bacterium]
MEEASNVQVIPADKEKIKKLWKIAGILGLVTAFEFLIAFTMGTGPLKVSIFVVLTIVKAFYIVAEFMHLGHEQKSLIWSILLPLVFVVWLIVALIIQGDAIFTAKY